jgi:hypothetical protein
LGGYAKNTCSDEIDAGVTASVLPGDDAPIALQPFVGIRYAVLREIET